MMKAISTVHLPVQTTPFLGREADIAALCDLLGRVDVRRVTIVGVGGMNKTRLHNIFQSWMPEAVPRPWAGLGS